MDAGSVPKESNVPGWGVNNRIGIIDYTMRIDSYSFGVMKVDGAEYRTDLIVFPDRIKQNWRRKEGHTLTIEDISDILEIRPEVLVVGKGASGLMRVPASTKKALQEQGIELIAEDTGRAWQVFNEQLERGKKTVGAFHLTC